MNIVVLVKQVPDTYSERKLDPSDGRLDRDATDAVLDEINERAVEAALQIKEANGGSEVTVVTMGPDRATEAIRKALSMGADKAVHLSDSALAGSDAVSTAKALAKVIGTTGEFDLVLAGNEASDGRGGATPAMVADLLGVPAITRATPEFVRRHTGQAIGGVAPLGHPAPIGTLVDVELARHRQVWAAAGHPHTVFPTTYDELLRLTEGTPAEVGPGPVAVPTDAEAPAR